MCGPATGTALAAAIAGLLVSAPLLPDVVHAQFAPADYTGASFSAVAGGSTLSSEPEATHSSSETGGDAGLSGHAEQGLLRVGTSGDYPPFSQAVVIGAHSAAGGRIEPLQLATTYKGFDLDVARAYAKDRGLALKIVAFSWPELSQDLQQGKFDVAMSGVTVNPQRSTLGIFSFPVLESGAVLLTHPASGTGSISAFNSANRRIAVNAGGHLEALAALTFPRAQLITFPDNQAVLTAALDRSVDAVVSDSIEASLWRRADPQLLVLGPFSKDRKAYLFAKEQRSRAADFNLWLLDRERDGTLTQLRRKWFGTPPAMPTATSLKALIACIDERLALMPLLAAVKQKAGLAIEAPQREQAVLNSALASLKAAAKLRGLTHPSVSDKAAEAFFRAMISNAKSIQQRRGKQRGRNTAQRGIEPFAPQWDLDRDLRPALIRIGEKIALLLAAWNLDLDREQALRALAFHLTTEGLDESEMRLLAGALAGLRPR